MKLDYELLDVFADAPFQGTQIPVVFMRERLTEQLKIAIAGEFRQTETVFIDLSAKHPDVAVYNERERTVFGAHTTLAAAYAANTHGLATAAGGVASFDIVQGKQLIMTFVDDNQAGITKVQFSRRFKSTIYVGAPDEEVIASALNIDASQLLLNRYSLMAVAVDHRTLIVPLTRPEQVYAAAPNIERLQNVLAAAHATEMLLFAPGALTGRSDFHARLLNANIAANEFPPVGKVMPEFVAYLCAQQETALGTHAITVDRGSPETRKSVIHIEFDHRSSREMQCRIGGHVIKIAEGRFCAPLRQAL